MDTTLSYDAPKTLVETTSISLDSSAFRFLDLPAELRVQIYEVLVVVGKVFFTPDWYEVEQSQRFTHWKDYRIPNLQVLRVCKQIYAEAADVYFAKNLFLLPPDYNLTYPFQHVEKGDTSLQPHKGLRLFSTTGLQKIRNLSIGFSLGSRVRMVMSASSWALAEGATMREFSAMGAAERLALAHVHAKNKQARFWSVLTQALARMPTKLSYLEVDFTNAFCPLGCCRGFNVDFEFLRRLKPKVLRVLGMRTEERELVRMKMMQGLKVGDITDAGIELGWDDGQDPWRGWRTSHEE
jgi:hypothetical protein